MARRIPDLESIYNAATVVSQGLMFMPDQPLIEPTYTVQTFFDYDVLAAGSPNAVDPIPDDRTPWPMEGDGRDSHGEIGVLPWPPGTLPGGNEMTITWSARVYSAQGNDPDSPSNLWEEGSNSGVVTVYRADTESTIQVSGTVNEPAGIPFTYTWGFRWVDAGILVSVRCNRPQPIQGGFPSFLTFWTASILEFEATGEAFVRTNQTIEGRFSLRNGNELPAAGDTGENALALSEAAYGPRELQVRTNIFPLDAEQANQIAQALVLHHINPRYNLTIRQSWWNAFPIKPDHVGRLVQLPSTEVARVISRTYADDHTHHILESTATVQIEEPIFDLGDVLLLDSGDFMAFDNGELVGRS